MNIETSALGVLNIKDEQIYHFPKGLPGFEQETEFAIIDLEEGQFSYLQSLKTAELAFLLTNPFIFFLIMNLNYLKQKQRNWKFKNL